MAYIVERLFYATDEHGDIAVIPCKQFHFRTFIEARNAAKREYFNKDHTYQSVRVVRKGDRWALFIINERGSEHLFDVSHTALLCSLIVKGFFRKGHKTVSSIAKFKELFAS